jgi:two-component system CheB/CheR fusion protein
MAKRRVTKDQAGRKAKRVTPRPARTVPPPGGRRPGAAVSKHKERREVEARPEERPFLVVGVGASAGGLEAFSALLREIPGDTAIAVVLVQHLARGHESLLPDLLKQSTALAVTQARNGVRIEPRHVYVIPPDARMTVTDGHLAVSPRAPDGHPYAPIDQFLGSLAQQYREKAIGVVLTGGGHDGALGLREIKAAGGITLAQEPDEATVDSMPRAAIDTGMVDLVLPAGRIAEELVRLAEHPFLSAARAAEVSQAATGERLRLLFQILRRASSVDFTHYKSPTLMRRIQRRMALHRLTTLDAYLALLQETPKEVEALQEDILIHVTSFFREPESFEVLKERIFPLMLQSRSDETPLRLWVPGCSSGEEAYSLAIALHELLGDNFDATPLQIFGTDVSQKMIDRARAGIYPETIAAEVGLERLRRFFVKVEGGFRISKSIRERCVFARQDLTRDPPFSKLQLVVCRNLLIYLGPPLQRKVIQVFHYALQPTGFLMLGRSETTGSQAELFSLLDKRFKVYRKKPGASVADLDFSAPLRPESPVAPARGPRALPPEPSRVDGDVQTEANRLILDRYGPPGVIVDSALRIVRTRGRTSPYLELPSGDASLDMLKMARQGLLFGLRNAVDESRSRGAVVRKEGLRVVTDGTVRMVDVEVTPMGNAQHRHFLVLFEEGGRANRDRAGAPATPKPDGKGRARRGDQAVAGQRQIELEAELEASRQYLQSIIQDLEGANEELQSANEEILSSNEELQSTNEELDTAKEELQSTNEELSTLNEELHGRNEELSRVNSDLLNVLASVHIPIVIVSSDLRIRRFTPAAEKLLNLIPADVGRPIGHIKPNIQCPDLEALISEVIDTVTIREREVTDREGSVYTLRVRPYKNVENRIDGALVTLFDVSAARDHAADLRIAHECAEAIISTVREPILLLDGELNVQSANRAFLETFQIAASETERRSIFALDGGQWDLPALRKQLGEVLPARKNFESFEIQREFPRIGHRRVLLDGRRFEGSRPAAAMIVLVVRDVTGHVS